MNAVLVKFLQMPDDSDLYKEDKMNLSNYLELLGVLLPSRKI